MLNITAVYLEYIPAAIGLPLTLKEKDRKGEIKAVVTPAVCPHVIEMVFPFYRR